MPRGLQQKGLTRRNKMLLAAVKLFLENGYEKTTTAAIARKAGMAPSSFFAAFENKETLLLVLTKRMFTRQFETTAKILKKDEDPLHTYVVQTVLQLYIAELSEPIREVYTMAYSLPSTMEFIYRETAEKWRQIFQRYVPECGLKDFYEMEIASAGMMRGFMAKKCDLYLTMEQKIWRFLYCNCLLYKVPDETREQLTEFVLHMDLKPIAEQIIVETVREAEAGLEAAMTDRTQKTTT